MASLPAGDSWATTGAHWARAKQRKGTAADFIENFLKPNTPEVDLRLLKNKDILAPAKRFEEAVELGADTTDWVTCRAEQGVPPFRRQRASYLARELLRYHPEVILEHLRSVLAR